MDEAVAATLLDCPGIGLAGLHRDWAVALLSGQPTASRPDCEDGFAAFRSEMGQLARSKAMRMTPQPQVTLTLGEEPDKGAFRDSVSILRFPAARSAEGIGASGILGLPKLPPWSIPQLRDSLLLEEDL